MTAGELARHVALKPPVDRNQLVETTRERIVGDSETAFPARHWNISRPLAGVGPSHPLATRRAFAATIAGKPFASINLGEGRDSGWWRTELQRLQGSNCAKRRFNKARKRFKQRALSTHREIS